MKLAHLTALFLLSVVALALAGCRTTAELDAPDATPTVALPEWAPKEPSAEFLRAAAVVKPIPTELFLASDPDDARAAGVLTRVWPACYEFLGSMSDEQISTLEARQELRMPYGSLTSAQTVAFERWMQAVGSIDVSEWRDYRAKLATYGAEDDLSNVDVGFAIHDGGVVGVRLWILHGREISTDFATTKDFSFDSEAETESDVDTAPAPADESGS